MAEVVDIGLIKGNCRSRTSSSYMSTSVKQSLIIVVIISPVLNSSVTPSEREPMMMSFSVLGFLRYILVVTVSSTVSGSIILPVSGCISTCSLRNGMRLNFPSWNTSGVTSLSENVSRWYLL